MTSDTIYISDGDDTMGIDVSDNSRAEQDELSAELQEKGYDVTIVRDGQQSDD